MKTVLEKVHKNKPRVQKASGAEGESKWQFWKDLHMPKQVKQLLKGKKDGKGVDQIATHSS